MQVAELKDKLDIVAVVSETQKLKRTGRIYQGEDHDSLKVNPDKARWDWYSRGEGGDALAWLAFVRFGRTKVDGADFRDVLADACRFAGIDFDIEFGKVTKSEAFTRRCDTLAAYMALARKCWTPARRVQIEARKRWITDDVIKRWGLGAAPTIAQIKKAGLDLSDLLHVGLVKRGKSKIPDNPEDPWDGLYPHFRDAMVIPFTDRGRTVYITSRRFNDTDARGEPLAHRSKALHLPSPKKDSGGAWTGGVPPVDGFNLDALNSPESRDKGLLVVEGPLDAIACCERGQPAVGLTRSVPGEGICKRLQRASVC